MAWSRSSIRSTPSVKPARRTSRASSTKAGHACRTQYDDGGFTGGNMDRPALRRLLADIEAGKVDCVVVYKVDRLSRSLLDFARIMETFDRHQVSFVSVTQAFNTATSMGRLVLNVLLSFAQFEREMISERTRDKIAAARRKGKWSGGMPSWATRSNRRNSWWTTPRPAGSGRSSNCTSSRGRYWPSSRNCTPGAGIPNNGPHARRERPRWQTVRQDVAIPCC